MSTKTELPVVAVVDSNPVSKKYGIAGLKLADVMPIEHRGVMYDLAKLTDEQVETLISQGCTYVVKG